MFDKQALVVQANKLIMTHQRFTYDEKRFIICLISKINPLDEDFKSYRIMFDEYASFIGQDIKYVRNTLPKITKSIMSQILEIEDDEEVLRQRSIITGSTHYKRFGFVDVKIDSDMKDVLLDLKERFTQYKLENALKMRSKHSIRLYEIIKANQFKEQKMFRLSWTGIPKAIRNEYPKEEIQKLLDTDYKQFADFEKRILKPAQEDMKNYTDICFDYKKIKLSRYVVAIDFYVKENIPTEKFNSKSVVVVPQTKDIGNMSLDEMKAEALKKIKNVDRIKLCNDFQKKVKSEYGVDFQLSMLEGISNETIAKYMPSVGVWKIKNRTQHTVTKYIMKILNEG